MKLAVLISSLGPGGAERVATILANRWAERGEDVCIVTLDDRKNPPAFSLSPKVLLQPLDLLFPSATPIHGIFNNIKRISAIRRVLITLRPDAVISFVHQMNILALIATRGLSVPIIISERVDPLKHRSSFIWEGLRSVLYEWAAALVVQGETIQSRFPLRLKRRTFIIPNPVLVPGPLSEPCSGRGGRKRVVAIGRLTHQKGFDLLIQAFSIIAGAIPDWDLFIWGEGEQREALESLRDRLGLSERTFLPGISCQPFEELRKSDLFVLPSRYEGFPNVLAEAMACGLPVISTNCPCGPSEIIRDGIDGVLIPVEDIQILAETMAKLMKDKQSRQDLSHRAPEGIKKFNPETVMQRWDSLLKEVLVR